jgi:hypothetical protein
MFLIFSVIGLAVVVVILHDAFETIVLPRRVNRRFRLARLFYIWTWRPFSKFARRVESKRKRETFLSFFGPLSLIALIGVWAFSLILGFALLHFGLQTPIVATGKAVTFNEYWYMSGETFFTLGYGDVSPLDSFGRFLAVIEAGTGFAFLAVVIGYLPVIYQAFSKREAHIAMLDARAGTPPSAAELLRRHAQSGDNHGSLNQLLSEWEKWAAELLESHLSYPVLCYYRSQHDNQSWIASLTTILDACALILVSVDMPLHWQAQLTFAMARHAIVDLAQIFNASPTLTGEDRMTVEDMRRLREILEAAGVPLRGDGEATERLGALRMMYEPYVKSLADFMLVKLPPWIPLEKRADNWQTSAFERNPQRVASEFDAACCLKSALKTKTARSAATSFHDEIL